MWCAPPVEFGAQYPVVIVTMGMNQGHAGSGTLYPYPVIGCQRLSVLPIAAHLGTPTMRVVDHNFNFTIALHHNRAVAECMWTDGHQDDGIHAGVQDRAAAGERVGGGAGGRGDDNAVGAMRTYEAAIHVSFKFDEPSAVGLLDDHVVECRPAWFPGVSVQNLGIQQQPLLCVVIALQDGA